MTLLPVASDHLVIRTDFSDPVAWSAVQADLAGTWDDEFDIEVTIVDDAAFGGLGPEQVLALAPKDFPQAVVMLADTVTMTSPDRLLLVLSLEQSEADYETDLREGGHWDEQWHGAGRARGWANEWPQRGGVFRSTATGVGAIAANLTFGNMRLWEFATAVDDQGVFRNFEDA